MAPSKTIPWRRFATPDGEFTYASSGTQASPDTMTFDLSGKNGGEQIQIDWGDGTFETLNLTTSTQGFSHDYTNSGSFTIRFFNANEKLNKINANRNSSLSGDIANLPTGASVYRFRNTSVSGDIANLPTGASEYRFFNTSVSGDIANLPTGASLYLFRNTSVSGDAAILHTLSANISNFFINDTDANTYTAGSYSEDLSGANLRLQDLNYTSTEVDNFLIDLDDSGASDGTLNIAGTNAARTSSSDTAINNLQSRGWSITVNT
jgi:hypothetical protein